MAEEKGWSLKAIKRDTQIDPVDFSDFEQRLVTVGEYIQKTLENTSYGISGAEDYSAEPRDGKVLGMFSIYTITHDKKSLMSLLDVGSVQVLTNGNLDSLVPGERYQPLQQILFGATAAKRVTREEGITNIRDHRPK